MQQLGKVAQARAVEFANALRTVGMDESQALRIAIATAKHLAFEPPTELQTKERASFAREPANQVDSTLMPDR